jgi:hypothetical protein
MRQPAASEVHFGTATFSLGGGIFGRALAPSWHIRPCDQSLLAPAVGGPKRMLRVTENAKFLT